MLEIISYSFEKCQIQYPIGRRLDQLINCISQHGNSQVDPCLFCHRLFHHCVDLAASARWEGNMLRIREDLSHKPVE